MFSHNKRLQYTLRVSESNPGLANLMLEQFGGAQGELAAACRYFTQAIGEDDPGRKDMLFDIATEELIRAISAGRRYISPAVAELIAQKLEQKTIFPCTSSSRSANSRCF